MTSLICFQMTPNYMIVAIWNISDLTQHCIVKQLYIRFMYNLLISAQADGGPRSPSAHAGPFACPPISMSGNFLAHVSAESPSNISPNPSEVISEVSEP